jgi:hypothetical protein
MVVFEVVENCSRGPIAKSGLNSSLFTFRKFDDCSKDKVCSGDI